MNSPRDITEYTTGCRQYIMYATLAPANAHAEIPTTGRSRAEWRRPYTEHLGRFGSGQMSKWIYSHFLSVRAICLYSKYSIKKNYNTSFTYIMKNPFFLLEKKGIQYFHLAIPGTHTLIYPTLCRAGHFTIKKITKKIRNWRIRQIKFKKCGKIFVQRKVDHDTIGLPTCCGGFVSWFYEIY